MLLTGHNVKNPYAGQACIGLLALIYIIIIIIYKKTMGMGQLLTLAADPYPWFSYKIILLIGTVLVKHNRVHGLGKAVGRECGESTVKVIY